MVPGPLREVRTGPRTANRLLSTPLAPKIKVKQGSENPFCLSEKIKPCELSLSYTDLKKEVNPLLFLNNLLSSFIIFIILSVMLL